MSQTLIHHNLKPSLQKCTSLRFINTNKNFTKFAQNTKASPKVELLKGKQKYLLNQSDNSKTVQMPSLVRVRSVDHFRQLQIQGFEELLEFQQKQNENLKEQNRFLLKQIRKKDRNEAALHSKIEELRKQIKSLERTKIFSALAVKSKGQISAKTKTPELQSGRNISIGTEMYSSNEESPNCKNSEDLGDLNIKFSSLIKRFSEQKCKKTKALLKQRLAETADKMKMFREQLI